MSWDLLMKKLEPLSVKEELIRKMNNQSSEENFRKGFTQGVDEAFQEFENSVDLFKRYENDVKLLMKEQKPVWKNWVSFFEGKKINQDEYLERYNVWLFEFVFLKGKRKKEESLLNL
jgi:hypothetical protein